MSSWKVAPALVELIAQVNAKWPGRDKSWDGTIGDTAHSSRASDHNPNDAGIVCALDVTNDPAHGLVSRKLAEALLVSRDPRIQYLISNGQIANLDIQGGAWRKYNGPSPHDHHCHVSVRQEAHFWNDTTLWKLDGYTTEAINAAAFVPIPPLLKRGMSGNSVMELQTLLGLRNQEVDGFFGSGTENLVKEWQKSHDLLPDGKVGPATWAKLKEKV